jgi:SanA protein
LIPNKQRAIGRNFQQIGKKQILFASIGRTLRTMFKFAFAAILFLVICTFALRLFSEAWSREYIYSVDDVPQKPSALVFGARVYASGRPSAMLADRIATGVDLFHAGKVAQLIMSGDGRSAHYNEPEAMRQYALSLGVPDEAILVDPYGLRTYDSCYRASEEFGITDVIVVTQEFHVDRALLTCRGLGLDAAAVAADYQRPSGYSRYSLTYSRLREIPATLAAAIDITTNAALNGIGQVF